jgi:hypothetical protein
MDYHIEGEDGQLHTKATTTQVPLDAISHELQFGTPAELIDRMEAYLNDN